MTTQTTPAPFRVWRVSLDEDENDMEIGLSIYRLVEPFEENEFCRLTSYVVADFDIPGLQTGDLIPYFIDGETEKLPPSELWFQYFTAFEQHGLRRAASIARAGGHAAFVIHYEACRSELHLVENFEPFDENAARHHLDTIWTPEAAR